MNGKTRIILAAVLFALRAGFGAAAAERDCFMIDEADEGRTLAFDYRPGTKRLYLAGFDGFVDERDSATGKLARRWYVGEAQQGALAASDDGATIALELRRGERVLLDTATGRVIELRFDGRTASGAEKLETGQFGISEADIALSTAAERNRLRENEAVAVAGKPIRLRGDYSGGLQVVDPQTGKTIQALSGPADGDWVNGVRYSFSEGPNAVFLVDGRESGIAAWELSAGADRYELRKRWELNPATTAPTDARFIAGKAALMSSHTDGSVRLWSVQTGRLVSVVEKGARLEHPSCSADGKFAAVAFKDGIAVSETRLWKETARIPRTAADPDKRFALSADGALLVAHGPKNELRIVDAETAGAVGSIPDTARKYGWRTLLASSKNLVLGIDAEGGVFLWKLPSGEAVTLDPEWQDLEKADDIAFSADGSRLFCRRGGEGRLYPGSGGARLASVALRADKEGGAVSAAALSADGTRIAVADEIGRLRVLDAESGAALESARLAPHSVKSLRADPYVGGRFAAVCRDKTIRVFGFRDAELDRGLIALTGKDGASWQDEGRLSISDPKRKDIFSYGKLAERSIPEATWMKAYALAGAEIEVAARAEGYDPKYPVTFAFYRSDEKGIVGGLLGSAAAEESPRGSGLLAAEWKAADYRDPGTVAPAYVLVRAESDRYEGKPASLLTVLRPRVEALSFADQTEETTTLLIDAYDCAELLSGLDLSLIARWDDGSEASIDVGEILPAGLPGIVAISTPALRAALPRNGGRATLSAKIERKEYGVSTISENTIGLEGKR